MTGNSWVINTRKNRRLPCGPRATFQMSLESRPTMENFVIFCDAKVKWDCHRHDIISWGSLVTDYPIYHFKGAAHLNWKAVPTGRRLPGLGPPFRGRSREQRSDSPPFGHSASSCLRVRKLTAGPLTILCAALSKCSHLQARIDQKCLNQDLQLQVFLLIFQVLELYFLATNSV